MTGWILFGMGCADLGFHHRQSKNSPNPAFVSEHSPISFVAPAMSVVRAISQQEVISIRPYTDIP